MRIISILLCMVMTVLGCSNSAPSDVIEEETYIDLMVELQLLQSYQKYEKPDSTTVDSLRDIIFKQYNVTENQFERSHQYYQDHDIRAQRDRIGKAVEELRKDRIAGQDSAATRDPETDEP